MQGEKGISGVYCDCRLPGSYDDGYCCLHVTDAAGGFIIRCVSFVASRAGDWLCSGCS